MNLLAWLVLVALAALLKRKRECSAELCTCGCTVAPFNYATITPGAGSPEPAEIPQILQAFVPKPLAHAAPPAVGPILAPYVPPQDGGGGTGGSNGGSGGGGTGGSGNGSGGGSGGSGTGSGGGWNCIPEFCEPKWGLGLNWFERYGIDDKGCCQK